MKDQRRAATFDGVDRLSGLSLEGSGRRREIRIPEARRGADFEARYDFDTLFYDAFETPAGITLVAPKMFGLEDTLTGGRLRIAGQAGQGRLRRYRRYDLVTIPARASGPVEVRLDGWLGRASVAPDRSHLFAGLDTAVTLQRDNRPEWIADWLRWHRDRHGLQAALIFDNGSTAYAPEDLLDRLRPLGLDRVVVVPVPQSYGPLVRGGGAKFLQSALLNIARLSYLSRARAVLQADIDELVVPEDGSVFDRARRSVLGYVPMAGRWLFPAPDARAPYRHADHTHTDPAARRCPPKYVIRPSGPLGGFSWEVHGLERFVSARWLAASTPGYWHMRGIGDSWNWDRSGRPETLQRDPEAQRLLHPGRVEGATGRATSPVTG